VIGFVVVRPLFASGEEAEHEDGKRQELEAAKEAKYREIRDAELDLQMGKLSKEDHRAVDAELRGEAIEILRSLDKLEGREPRG
jgi:hypothetical protein